eukprot:gene27478-33160_t
MAAQCGQDEPAILTPDIVRPGYLIYQRTISSRNLFLMRCKNIRFGWLAGGERPDIRRDQRAMCTGRIIMKKYATALAGVALAVSLAGPALAKDKIIGLTDVESLIAQGANALIILAQDSSAIGPAVEKAVAEGIPVVGYDRLIENKDAFYITFDNKEVGRMQARGVLAVKPEGNYAFIKGSSADPNADFLFSGAQEVLKDAIASGKIKNVGEAYTDGWLPANAQKNMEQFLTKNDNKIDAVVAANDGTAGGAIAALQAQGLAGTVPVSGQDADFAALNRIALGTQTVSVWKDSRELGKEAAGIAAALADGKKMGDI